MTEIVDWFGGMENGSTAENQNENQSNDINMS